MRTENPWENLESVSMISNHSKIMPFNRRNKRIRISRLFRICQPLVTKQNGSPFKIIKKASFYYFIFLLYVDRPPDFANIAALQKYWLFPFIWIFNYSLINAVIYRDQLFEIVAIRLPRTCRRHMWTTIARSPMKKFSLGMSETTWSRLLTLTKKISPSNQFRQI